MCTGGCGQFDSIRFDASIPAGTGQYYPDSSGGNASAYVIGIQGATTPADVEQALYNGLLSNTLATVSTNPTSVTIGHAAHDTRLEIDPITGNYSIKRDDGDGVGDSGSHFVMYNGFKGAMVTKEGYLPQENFYVQGDTKSSQETRLHLPNTTLNILFPDVNSDWDIVPTDDDYPKAGPGGLEPGSIEFKYYDEKYNLNGNLEDIRRAKWYDEVWPYPRKDAKATASCVLTRQDANKFLKDIDQAIKYLLHCSTTLGAQSQRLSAMNDNIITGNENTQASESTIRDADMAKEMVTYTKHNVLTQTAQSMLSQANQNSSGVLDILQ